MVANNYRKVVGGGDKSGSEDVKHKRGAPVQNKKGVL
jgi:hypothetical protein